MPQAKRPDPPPALQRQRSRPAPAPTTVIKRCLRLQFCVCRRRHNYRVIVLSNRCGYLQWFNPHPRHAFQRREDFPRKLRWVRLISTAAAALMLRRSCGGAVLHWHASSWRQPL